MTAKEKESWNRLVSPINPIKQSFYFSAFKEGMIYIYISDSAIKLLSLIKQWMTTRYFPNVHIHFDIFSLRMMRFLNYKLWCFTASRIFLWPEKCSMRHKCAVSNSICMSNILMVYKIFSLISYVILNLSRVVFLEQVLLIFSFF